MSVEAPPQSSAPERQADGEMQRVQYFQEALATASAKVTDIQLDLDTPDPVADETRHFLWTQRTTNNTLHLHPDYGELQEKGEATFVPYQSRSGKYSAHGVFFGDMLFQDGSTVSVAVKPHETETDKSCLTDYLTNLAIKQMNFDTLEPVGMLIAPNNINYSITRLEQIETLDSIDWASPHIQKNAELMNVWSQAARLTGMLHASGSVDHGDLAARNIALRVDGSVFLMDWEGANISKLPPRDAEVAYAHSRKDLGELMESLVRKRHDPYKGGVGLLADHPDPWRGFCDVLFDEYVATRVGFAEAQGNVAQVHSELQELENSLKSRLDFIMLDSLR